MLSRLRRRLTLICALSTGAVLFAMVLLSMAVFRSRLQNSQSLNFQSSLDAIAIKLQSDQALTHTWLAQTEAGGGLIVDILDQGQPLLFTGAWTPPTDRAALIAKAQQTARDQYGLDVRLMPVSALERAQAVFSLTGDVGDRYLAAVATLPVARGWYGLTLIKDMGEETAATARLQAQLYLLALFGVAALVAVSWRLSGRAIRPIAQSQRKQADFVAAASHELKSPLAVIRASVSAQAIDPEQAASFSRTIDLECARMARLIDDLLLLAGSDAHSWSVLLQPIDMDTLLLTLAEAYEPIFAQSGHHLVLELPDDPLPAIQGDSGRLHQALAILLDNALHYTPAGCTVRVSAQVRGRALLVSVADNGPGIPPEQRERVFDRFYRGDASHTDKQHFGLGLSIAQELAALHQGRLTLHETPGGGARFVLELPLPARRGHGEDAAKRR